MRRLGRVLKWLGYFAVALLAAGAIYQQIGTALDAALAPPPSEMITVEGHAIHFVCSGDGPRTYVLDAGAGVWSFEFARLKPLLAKSARVCAFDRPGLGWSDDMPGGHDAASLAEQVFKIVHAASIPSPFIYVGHSLGANIGELYLGKYPRDLAALVLIEPGFPKWLLDQFPTPRETAMASADCDWQCDAATAAGYMGAGRLAGAIMRPGAKSLPPEAAAQYRTGLARPSTLRAIVATLHVLPKTAYQVMAIRSFGQTPVLTIASERPVEPDEGEAPAHFAETLQEERDYLTALAALSTHGAGVVVIPNSNHGSMVTGEAQSVITAQAIETFVAGIRN
jgi:pimeloyl-ACP methyl ester carboxylesterase